MAVKQGKNQVSDCNITNPADVSILEKEEFKSLIFRPKKIRNQDRNYSFIMPRPIVDNIDENDVKALIR